jgi:heme exporter protein CcmD
MDLSAAHSGFVIGAYALSAAVLFGLFIYTIARDHALRIQARDLAKSREGDRP